MVPRNPLWFVNSLPPAEPGWLQAEGFETGCPYLISPLFEYDVNLNNYFSKGMVGSARKTKEAAARDLASFLTFLWRSRGNRGWRDADEDDHIAYSIWRRKDPAGPTVKGSTWNREVATVNKFYWWAVRKGHVAAQPIPQRVGYAPPAGHRGRGVHDGMRPATYSHEGTAENVSWLTPAAYRTWRDVGLRGFRRDGLPNNFFRGRWADRNATYCDLMVRTGLRISEQSALSVLELPHDTELVGFQRFWLPLSIAKGASARWVYVPPALLSDLNLYIEVDRAELVDGARGAGRYRWPRPWVIEDPRIAVATRRIDGLAQRMKLKDAEINVRREMLVDYEKGIEPVLFWLGESGMPLSVSAWKAIFRDANKRCKGAGINLSCHPHALRHTFAVVTLEQLQRGHIDALGRQTPEQRRHYTRIFGDPLDWVRRRLGHRSVTSTMVYLHALSELEMQTRMALVPAEWDEVPTEVIAEDETDCGDTSD
ncbi:hypothetical protein A5722_17975 [Mycobacterium vulneris]|nr:hypothetical protein A5722_17975 [Mycolicibacterium vulneris]OCB64154.1 hypothetical protein A5729_22045 [Mycolicibacterium vulneris]